MLIVITLGVIQAQGYYVFAVAFVPESIPVIEHFSFNQLNI